MMSNFGFLDTKKEYTLFSPDCIDAEKIYASAPAMCAVCCRKALELAVKWVYAADETVKMPYKNNLQSLIHEPSFRFTVDSNTWGKLPFIIKLGNLAVHTERNIQPSDALASLKSLFEFIQWIDYCYGSDYQERTFDENLIPTEKVIVDTQKIKEQEGLLNEKDAEIEALRKQIEQMSAQYTAEKEKHQQERSFQPEDLSEFKTRKIYIDVDLKSMGWKFTGADADVEEERPVKGMAGVPGQTGYCDYVLFGKDGLPLAVIKAKRTSKDPNIGRKQAVLYADCLEQEFGRRPMIFTTNGFETYFWDDRSGPQRTLAIYKLTHNIPLSTEDYRELERVLTSELGSNEDYKREFGDTPFGLLIRKIAKLDHDAIMQAFSTFINDQSLNQKQIAFINKIINHIELNGYMENVSELTKPPFDKPVSFIKLFDTRTKTALMATIEQIKENAVQITAS